MRNQGSERGQSLIESALAVALFTIVCLCATQAVSRHAKSTVQLHQLDSDRQLADMVLEQYESLVNSPNLASHNVVNQPPSVFFNSADNFGFDHSLLTTQAVCGTSGSLNCDVTVTIRGDTPGSTIRTFKRTYIPHTGKETGATVDVWVVQSPCSQDQPQTCTGIGGFEILASSSVYGANYKSLRGTSQIIGYTRADGHAVLRNVALGSVTISAHKPGTASWDVRFSQGYYVQGTTTSMDSQMIVTTTRANVVVFSNFLPLGKISGTLSGAASLGNMIVALQGYASSGFGILYNPLGWAKLTDSNGGYVFNNVLPGNFQIMAVGDPGSHYAVTPADTGHFRQGYTNRIPYPSTLDAPLNVNAPTSQTVNVSVSAMGSLRVSAVLPDGTPVASGSIMTRLPPTFFRHSVPLTLDLSHGAVSLFNVFDTNDSTMSFSGNGANTSGNMLAYCANLQLTHFQTGGENQVLLTLKKAYTIQGVLLDSATPHNPLPMNPYITTLPIKFAATGGGLPQSQGTIDSSGNIILTGFAPELSFTRSSNLVGLTLPSPDAWQNNIAPSIIKSGQISDSVSGPIPGFYIEEYRYPAFTLNVTNTDSNGNYTLNSNNIIAAGGGYSVLVPLSCNDVTAICTLSTPGGIIYSDRTLTQSSSLHVGAENDSSMIGWGSAFVLSNLYHLGDAQSTGNDYQVTLDQVWVSGNVTDPAGNPIMGIKVCDRRATIPTTDGSDYPPVGLTWSSNMGGACAVTDSSGHFSAFAIVENRGPAGNSGDWEFYVPSGQTDSKGKAYGGSEPGPQSIPANPNPSTVGLDNNHLTLAITLTPAAGGI